MMAVIVMSLEQAEALRDFHAAKMKPNGVPLSPTLIAAATKFAQDVQHVRSCDRDLTPAERELRTYELIQMRKKKLEDDDNAE